MTSAAVIAWAHWGWNAVRLADRADFIEWSCILSVFCEDIWTTIGLDITQNLALCVHFAMGPWFCKRNGFVCGICALQAAHWATCGRKRSLVLLQQSTQNQPPRWFRLLTSPACESYDSLSWRLKQRSGERIGRISLAFLHTAAMA